MNFHFCDFWCGIFCPDPQTGFRALSRVPPPRTSHFDQRAFSRRLPTVLRLYPRRPRTDPRGIRNVGFGEKEAERASVRSTDCWKVGAFSWHKPRELFVRNAALDAAENYEQATGAPPTHGKARVVRKAMLPWTPRKTTNDHMGTWL